MVFDVLADLEANDFRWATSNTLRFLFSILNVTELVSRMLGLGQLHTK